MNTARVIINVLHIIFAVIIIVSVLLQSGKSAGLSGSISGGAETFFGKNKGRTLDALFSKLTSFSAIAFLATAVTLYYVINKL